MVDVALHPQLIGPQQHPGICVLVDALAGSPALAAALDDSDETLTLPTAYTERLTTIAVAIASEHAATQIIVGALPNARPCVTALARLLAATDANQPRLTFVCTGSGHEVAAPDVYVAGALVRMLLEECDAALMLTDAAGIAVSIASTFADDQSALSASAGDDDTDQALRQLATQRDLYGAVPELLVDPDGVVTARRLA